MNKLIGFSDIISFFFRFVLIAFLLTACSNDSTTTPSDDDNTEKDTTYTLISSVAGEITFEVDAGEYEITKNDKGIDVIEMKAPGYGSIQSPGDPLLPEKILEFPVPQDIDPTSVKISIDVTESDVLAGYNIEPALPLRPVADTDPNFTFEYDPNEEIWGIGKSIVNGKNMLVYGKDANYPEHSINILDVTQRKVPYEPVIVNSLPVNAAAVNPPEGEFINITYVRVAFRPFLYNPITQQLSFTKKATVTINYESAIPAPASAIQPLSNGTYDYVIITTNNIVANSSKLGNFIHLKQLAGHNVLVVTETDYGVLTGQAPNGTAEKIRQWLKNNYIALGIDYVLLIGDPDPDDPANSGDSVGDVPMKMCWPSYFSWTNDKKSPTDYFYADLTGNWNLDNDDFFCEALESTHETSPDPSIDEDTFSAQWTGKVMFDFTEEYHLHTYSDDGVRVYLDGSLIIDEWTQHPPTNHYATQNMTAGKHDITLEFRETTGDGIIRLLWYTDVPDTDPHYVKHQTIPQDHLYDTSDVVGGLSATYYDNADFTGTTVSRKDNTIDFIWGTGDQGPGGTDSGAEVFVGRIPVYNNDYAQLDAILNKIIQYQADAGDISWRSSILLPMKPLWPDTPAYHLGEGIRNDFALAAGYTVFRIYDEDYNPPTPELWPTTIANVSGEWANGYGVVTWATHGSATSAGSIFTSNDTGSLDDSKPAFTFQASCLNGYPENSNNLGYALLKRGAIATVSASRVSYDRGGAWTFDPHDGSNHNLAYYYDKKLMDGVTPQPAGVALYLTKGDISYIGMNESDYNLYGDPETYLLSTLANSPPFADANGPYVADEGTAISFDASASYDPEGETLEYRWDFENDGVWDTDWSKEPTAENTWCDDFTGNAKVLVRDLLGLTDEGTATVTVTNVAPTADAGPDQTVNEGEAVHFTGSYFDPGCDSWTFEWNFGDGSPIASGDLNPVHAYGDNGTYTVTLTVTDDDGGVGTDTLTITVNNVAPTAQIDSLDQPNPQFILPVVHTLDFNGSFSDPGWLDTHTATWDFGDSTVVASTISEENNPPDATGTTTASHVYSSPGVYTVTLTVVDDDGGVGTDTYSVTVVNAEQAKHDINDYIQALPDHAFKNNPQQHKSALNNMFAAIDKMLQNGAYQGAISDLRNNIRGKADGYVDGNPNNDWIIDPTAQQEICAKIDDLIAYLEYLKNL